MVLESIVCKVPYHDDLQETQSFCDIIRLSFYLLVRLRLLIDSFLECDSFESHALLFPRFLALPGYCWGGCRFC